MPRKQKNKTKKHKHKKQEKREKYEQKNKNNNNNNNENKDNSNNYNNKINDFNKSKKNRKEKNKNRKKNKRNREQDEIDEKFKKHLETLGFFIREVGGDGNCLFRAVCEQIEGNENNYAEYREKCINYMKENKDTFQPFIEDDEPIDKYIERMSKNSEWGGNLEIYALSMLLEANFYIYIYEHPMYIVKNFEKPKRNVLLTYHDGKHYNSLRKKEEKTKDDIEKEEKKKKEREKEREKEDNEENEEESDDNEEDEKDDNDYIKELINKVDTLNI